MKKIVVVSFLLFLAVTVFAQVSIGVMGRVGFDSSIANESKDFIKNFKQSKLDYGGGGYISWNFFKGLGIQAEAAYVLNKGIRFKDDSGSELSFSLSVVEVPIMLNYTFFPTSPFRMKLSVGPRFSFTIGDIRVVQKVFPPYYTGYGEPDNTTLIGITGGVDFSYGFNSSTALFAGIRYGRDFTKVINDYLTLSELYFNIGLEYRFNKAKK